MEVGFIIAIVAGVLVYADAKRIGVRPGLRDGLFDMSPGGWGWLTGLLLIIGLPAYLVLRSDLERAARGEVSPASPPKPRYCSECGTQLHAGGSFCPGCGASMKG